jgi:hypothetical protein
VENGVRIADFEEILREYVRTRSKEYYNWKAYQDSIKYAGYLLKTNR